ncbi:MAG: general secretion pathway protein GspB [Proteobacteria bacterium]|nr:general secretion pathway protein GspB [Pseudomonadota bacterium]MBU1387613.1 general secretion pathway protein GspB [Pseudomonadota bacterium]MBU1544204.1 general secretion pathway protein GspB [Pseudomonadota bacterium]
MSSILKALKKAEQDGSLHSNNPDLKINLQRIFDSKSWTSAKGNTFKLPKILLAIGILAITGFVCFHIVSTNNIPNKPSSDNRPTVPKTAPSPKPAILPVVTPEDIPELKYPDPISESPKLSDPMPANETAQKTQTSDLRTATENITDDNSIEEIKEDSSFKVQAISWAKIPEDRIAVVNNTIVAENDFIQDYRIVNIGKDEIIVEKSGKKFSLKFKYR